ncbi:transposase IS605 family protein, partial [Lacticaseibacillus rhamnosus MTCC 5462]
MAKADAALLRQTMDQYRLACDNVSRYVFDHDFVLNTTKLQMVLYCSLRARFGLKAQMAQSVLRTVIARYRAVHTQLKQRPYRYQDEAGQWQRQAKDLTWLWHHQFSAAAARSGPTAGLGHPQDGFLSL